MFSPILHWICVLILASGLGRIGHASGDRPPGGKPDSSIFSERRCSLDTVVLHDETLFQEPLQTDLHFVQSPSRIAQLRPILVLLPGGPGLSSRTLEPLRKLSRSFDLIFVDPPGTGRPTMHVFDPSKGNQYEWVMKDIAVSILKRFPSFRGRSFVLVGHSTAAVWALDIAVLYRDAYIPNLQGVVMISGGVTHRSYQAMCEVREQTRGKDKKYRENRSNVLDWRYEKWAAHYDRAFRRHEGQLSIIGRRQFLMGIDRKNYIAWALAYQDLIWSERDKEQVIALLNSDQHSCSPEAVRHVGKAWRHDEARGNWTASQIAALPGLKKLMILGTEDRLVAEAELRKDAALMGAEILSIEGGSHFSFIVGLDQIARKLETLFPPTLP